jgi:hypothetical protein
VKESGYRLYPASEGYKEALKEGTEGTGFVGRNEAALTGHGDIPLTKVLGGFG